MVAAPTASPLASRAWAHTCSSTAPVAATASWGHSRRPFLRTACSVSAAMGGGVGTFGSGGNGSNGGGEGDGGCGELRPLRPSLAVAPPPSRWASYSGGLGGLQEPPAAAAAAAAAATGSGNGNGNGLLPLRMRGNSSSAGSGGGGGGGLLPYVAHYATSSNSKDGVSGGNSSSTSSSCNSGNSSNSSSMGTPGSSGPGESAPRSPSHIVSEHVQRQATTPPASLDPVGSHDTDQPPPPSTAAAAEAGAGAAGAGAGAGADRGGEARVAHGSLPPLDALRLPEGGYGNGYRNGTAAGGSSDRGGGANACAGASGAVCGDVDGVCGGGVSAGSGGGSGGGVNGGGGVNDGLAGLAPLSWVGPSVAAVPCGTVGYGTRAEVVARLPASIMLLRHAECMTLDCLQSHERVPNHDIPLSAAGEAQARLLGARLRPLLAAAGMHLFLYTSPFLRCEETTRLIAEALGPGLLSGCREAVQLREQDWGNFQDPQVQAECKEERLRYGRFYYRFPAGESVADVYDRLTIFQDHLVRDMCAGRFAENTCVAIVSHGLTLRVFAMRWLHWTVRQFLEVYNIPNAEPVLLHKDVHPSYLEGDNAHLPFMPHHTKCLYRLTPRAVELLRGADASMAVSSGCWQGALLKPPPPPHRKEGREEEEEEARQWADVEGMV